MRLSQVILDPIAFSTVHNYTENLTSYEPVLCFLFRREITSQRLRVFAFSPNTLSSFTLSVIDNTRTRLTGSGESSTSPSSPLSSSSTSSSFKSISPPLNTSSGVALVGLSPVKNDDRGAAIEVDIKADALSMNVGGLRIGMELRM